MPGPFGSGCFCCTSSLCRRALLPDHAGAFTSLSITNFIMIYCLTVSERSSIVPYTSSTGLWQRLQPRCKLLSSPIIKNHPCGQNNPATGVIFYLLFYFVHLTAYSMVTSVLSASASAGISVSSGRTSTSKAAPHSAQTILSLSIRVSSSTMLTVPQLGQVTS